MSESESKAASRRRKEMADEYSEDEEKALAT